MYLWFGDFSDLIKISSNYISLPENRLASDFSEGNRKHSVFMYLWIYSNVWLELWKHRNNEGEFNRFPTKTSTNSHFQIFVKFLINSIWFYNFFFTHIKRSSFYVYRTRSHLKKDSFEETYLLTQEIRMKLTHPMCNFERWVLYLFKFLLY